MYMCEWATPSALLHLLAPPFSLKCAQESRVQCCKMFKFATFCALRLSLLAWVICSGNDNHNSPRSPNQNQNRFWIAEAEVEAETQTEPQHWRDPVGGAEMTTPLAGREEKEAGTGTGQTNKHSQSSRATEAAQRSQQQQQRQRCGFWFWVIHPAQKNLRCVRLLLSTRVCVCVCVCLHACCRFCWLRWQCFSLLPSTYRLRKERRHPNLLANCSPKITSTAKFFWLNRLIWICLPRAFPSFSACWCSSFLLRSRLLAYRGESFAPPTLLRFLKLLLWRFQHECAIYFIFILFDVCFLWNLLIKNNFSCYF